MNQNIVKGLATVGLVIASTAAFAVDPTTPMEVLTQNSTSFLDDTKEIIFAGAGLTLAGYLVIKLVNLVLTFFKRG